MKLLINDIATAADLAAAKAEGAQWVSLCFDPESDHCVQLSHIPAGILPDKSSLPGENDVRRVGVFRNDMAQNIITRVVIFGLDAVLFTGNESPALLRNLRATIVPDLRPALQLWKAGAPQQEYADVVDAFVERKGKLIELKIKN